ncbi:PEP-CTERM sorting domain-containing protein [bacterium]|nr:MAG: PEP-CTERM sorting domain-containing protein [bacterium]
MKRSLFLLSMLAVAGSTHAVTLDFDFEGLNGGSLGEQYASKGLHFSSGWSVFTSGDVNASGPRPTSGTQSIGGSGSSPLTLTFDPGFGKISRVSFAVTFDWVNNTPNNFNSLQMTGLDIDGNTSTSNLVSGGPNDPASQVHVFFFDANGIGNYAQSVSLTPPAGPWRFDDLQVEAENQVNAVPEPASMAALSLGGLALLRRRRNKA